MNRSLQVVPDVGLSAQCANICQPDSDTLIPVNISLSGTWLLPLPSRSSCYFSYRNPSLSVIGAILLVESRMCVCVCGLIVGFLTQNTLQVIKVCYCHPDYYCVITRAFYTDYCIVVDWFVDKCFVRLVLFRNGLVLYFSLCLIKKLKKIQLFNGRSIVLFFDNYYSVNCLYYNNCAKTNIVNVIFCFIIFSNL